MNPASFFKDTFRAQGAFLFQVSRILCWFSTGAEVIYAVSEDNTEEAHWTRQRIDRQFAERANVFHEVCR